jgi:hypothetical protein
MVEGCEQPTALQSHLVQFAAAKAGAAIVERRMALIGRMEKQAAFAFLLEGLGRSSSFVGISLQLLLTT